MANVQLQSFCAQFLAQCPGVCAQAQSTTSAEAAARGMTGYCWSILGGLVERLSLPSSLRRQRTLPRTDPGAGLKHLGSTQERSLIWELV